MAQKFSKLDLAHAYLQLCLENKSESLVTVNTHCDLLEYNQLSFGVSTAPAIFQQNIDSQGILNVCAYLDDIIITRKTEKEHFTEYASSVIQAAKSWLAFKEFKVLFYG